MAESKFRVLVVEDNEVLRKIAIINLRKFPVDVDWATNGREAVEKFKAHCYALILMDIAMPEMTGLRATELIREAETHTGRRVPIVAVTAAGQLDECMQCGMDDFIQKPPDYERILRKWLPEIFPGGKRA